MKRGFLVLESGDTFAGEFLGGAPQFGEVVFNTSHAGYEEIATDPSYYAQIVVMTAPQQGNYGIDNRAWESKALWIRGFICLEMQKSQRDSEWLSLLTSHGVPVLQGVDTRSLVLKLRESGTPWGAIVAAENATEALTSARSLIQQKTTLEKDWVHVVTRKTFEERKGSNPQGPRVAVLDFGCKENILREVAQRASSVGIFPSRSTPDSVLKWQPDGIVLSNGPGDPSAVDVSVDTISSLLGKKFMFGICMGHQLLALAVGGKTYKLKFGHRGANHPIRDDLLNMVYMSSQNHGYAVDQSSLPKDVRVTHKNLYDQTVAGMVSDTRNFMSVQFHPESHPGPHESETLFDYFVRRLT